MKKTLAWLLICALLLGGSALAADRTEGAETDFESGIDGWYARSSDPATVTVTDAQAHEGTYSLYVEGRTAPWNGPGRVVPLAAGRSYTVRVWVYHEDPSTVEFILSAETINNGISSYANITRKSVPSGVWTQIEGKYTATASAKTVLYIETSGAAKVSFYIDDFSADNSQPGTAYRFDIPSLKEVYADSFVMGMAVTASEMYNAPRLKFLTSQFASLTPGNELKPDSVFDFAQSRKRAAAGDQTHPAVHLDAVRPILNYARDNGLLVHGHVLVWHQQTPRALFAVDYNPNGKLVDRDTMLARLENYIAAVFEAVEAEYPGLIRSWDVVNEAALDSDRGALRPAKTLDNANGSYWVDTIGNDYILQAFRFARKYAPEGTELVYNDYNIPFSFKLPGIITIVSQLQKEGLIDTVGFQGHYSISSPTAKEIDEAIATFVSMGLKIRVSELDITCASDKPADQMIQAKRYLELMEIFLKYSDSIDAVTMWGTTDDLSWRSTQYPLVFDGDGQPKYAFWILTDPSQLPSNTKEAAGLIVDAYDEALFALCPVNTFGDNSFRAMYADGKLYVLVDVADATFDKTDTALLFYNGKSVFVNRDKATEIEGGYRALLSVAATLGEGGQVAIDVMSRYIGGRCAWNDQDSAIPDRQYGLLTLKRSEE